MLTKGSIETFKNVLRTFIKSILDFIKKLRSGWRLRGEARSIWRQAHTPDPMHWDLNEAKMVQYYYFREAYKWEYKQGQVQVRVTARERKESMAIDPSLENGYHWDDEERIADQQKGRARKNAAKYAVLYEELINAKKRRLGLLPPLPPPPPPPPPRPKEPPEPLIVYTLGYNEAKVRCDIDTEPTLNGGDCRARKAQIARDKRIADLREEMTSEYQEAIHNYKFLKKCAIEGRIVARLNDIVWPDKPPRMWQPPCAPKLRASGHCPKPIALDDR
jgi:hypothetical protein